MSFTRESCPKLRWPLDVQQFEQDNQRFLLLRDSSGVAPEPALVPVAFAPIVSCFDGRTTIAMVADRGLQFGVTEQLVSAIASELDRMLFLDSPAAQEKQQAMTAAFAAAPVRPAALAGGAYPADAAALERELERYISQHGVVPFAREVSERVVGLIAPHIDYRRGWQTYGAAYSVLEQVDTPRVIFLLGTAHQPGGSIFHLTRKDFATPLATLRSATPSVDRLAAAYGITRAFEGEILHKSEHSIELQLPFIAHRFPNGARPQIVPILVGSFQQFIFSGSSPSESAEVSCFIGALGEELRRLRSSGEGFLVYCGVDLAHKGMHFGDPDRYSDSQLPNIEIRDRLLLASLEAADEQALFAHIAEDRDQRRICGFPAIYTALAAFRRAGIKVRGRLIDYRQAVDASTDCIVTFAGLGWTEESPGIGGI